MEVLPVKTVSLDITNNPIEVVGSHENDNTLLPSQMVTTWLRDQQKHFEVTKSHPKSTNLNKCNEPQPGPSGQFRFGSSRSSQILAKSNQRNLDKVSKPISKRLFKEPLMTSEEIEAFLDEPSADEDQTPTRKRK